MNRIDRQASKGNIEAVRAEVLRAEPARKCRPQIFVSVS